MRSTKYLPIMTGYNSTVHLIMCTVGCQFSICCGSRNGWGKPCSAWIGLKLHTPHTPQVVEVNLNTRPCKSKTWLFLIMFFLCFCCTLKSFACWVRKVYQVSHFGSHFVQFHYSSTRKVSFRENFSYPGINHGQGVPASTIICTCVQITPSTYVKITRALPTFSVTKRSV